MSNTGLAPQTALKVLILCAIVGAAGPVAAAQDLSGYIFQTGQPSFLAVDKFPGGSAELSNGNLHIEIPLAGPSQRGSLPINLKLVYDSRLIWAVALPAQKWTTTQGSWGASGHIGALGWRIVGGPEAEGREFESPRARHLLLVRPVRNKKNRSSLLIFR
jgi:hypothetical protein